MFYYNIIFFPNWSTLNEERKIKHTTTANVRKESSFSSITSNPSLVSNQFMFFFPIAVFCHFWRRTGVALVMQVVNFLKTYGGLRRDVGRRYWLSDVIE